MGCLGTYLNCYYHFTYLGDAAFLTLSQTCKAFPFFSEELETFRAEYCAVLAGISVAD